MASMLPGSKHGEGIGGSTQETSNPDNPTFNHASHMTETDKKITWLLSLESDAITNWDREFLISAYGKDHLSKKQHVRVWRIHKACLERQAEKSKS